jgi:hypothetical protein
MKNPQICIVSLTWPTKEHTSRTGLNTEIETQTNLKLSSSAFLCQKSNPYEIVYKSIHRVVYYAIRRLVGSCKSLVDL